MVSAPTNTPARRPLSESDSVRSGRSHVTRTRLPARASAAYTPFGCRISPGTRFALSSSYTSSSCLRFVRVAVVRVALRREIAAEQDVAVRSPATRALPCGRSLLAGRRRRDHARLRRGRERILRRPLLALALDLLIFADLVLLPHRVVERERNRVMANDDDGLHVARAAPSASRMPLM